MRALALFLLIVGCKPSATIKQTTPVANLQSYQTVALRVRSTAFAAQGLAVYLENAVWDRLRQTCAFTPVAANQPSDVVLDLNITNHTRGGSGIIRNENQVIIDTLLVLSDGTDGELLGTAAIQGKSSGTVINNSPQEPEAIDAIAKLVSEVLQKSGCAGARVAKAPVQQPDQGSGAVAQTGSGSGSGSATTPAGPATPDESKRAEAEKLNEQGKEKLFNADTAGALALFQQANQLLPDAKYQFNVCIALGAANRIGEATTACKQAKAMNPPPKLAAKIDQRLQGLAQGQ